MNEFSNSQKEANVRRVTEEVIHRNVKPIIDDSKILYNLVNSGMSADQAYAELKRVKKGQT